MKADKIYQPIKEIIADKNSKKYFIYLIIIYLVGYASILRADVYYIDDIGRSFAGYSSWDEHFSRHLSELFSKFLHMGWKISDISPLTQIIAIVVLSISSILLVKIVNRRLRFVPILASSCIGLFPYFLENISYKFDSPYMAFSILSSIIPFLWYKSSKKYFVIFSILGILCTLLTYQMAMGVYPIIFIFLIVKDFLQKKTLKELFPLFILSICSYFLALIMYRYIFWEGHPAGWTYVSTSIFPLSELYLGVYTNLKTYFLLIKKDLFNGFIGYALFFLCILYIVKLLLLSEQKKLKSFIVSSASLVIMALFLWGG